jgi:NADPH:quinone reductase-like Zn-dependent oxidoreductase
MAHRRAFAAALVAAAGGEVGAVFDPMGGKGLSRTRRALKPGGMRVAFGFLKAILYTATILVRRARQSG